MGCNSCLHPTCKQSAAHNMICECPGEDSAGRPCPGSLILDVNSKPNWKLACNQMHCNTLIRFRADIHNIAPQPHIPCPECGIRTAAFEFNKLRSPLPNGMTTYVGCVLCDEFLNSLTEVVAGRTVNLLVQRQERYRRGGMGRGGRGRGRGRRGGRGRHADVKMSFADF
jgi:DNA-directed RNA polymerase subunit M/transcription elongation factor TFIIS